MEGKASEEDEMCVCVCVCCSVEQLMESNVEIDSSKLVKKAGIEWAEREMQ